MLRVIPFIIIPTCLLICEYIDNSTTISMSLFFVVTPILLSFIMGILSSTHNKFDYIMTVIMPLSSFCFMFVGGFFDKSDLGVRFRLDRDFKTALQPACLIVYCCMAISVFLSSQQKVRTQVQKHLKQLRPFKKDKL